ncbi:MAG: hypothetical protein NC205_03310 [Prevotella sp.]|nr:hypothetical protein [Alistipes senegalensis]MCM1357596.1 hypothetical protein [Prevotella sp.]
MKLKQNFKRVVSSVLCLSTLAMYIPTIPVYAEPNTEDSKEFQYTMFASSNEDGAIAVNASNFTINGQIATNGTIKCTGNTNIDYENSNNICVDMVYIPNKIDSDFFNGRKVDNVEDDYSVEEPNIDISEPLAVNGDTTMQGNVTIQAGVKSKGDINISGDVKNSYNTVIYSQYGDINIDCNNVSLNGLIYAPFGTIHINAINLNMNDTMIIANKIIIDAPNVNMNYSKHFGSYFSEVSDKMEIPEEDFGYLKDLNDNGIPDFFENSINWKYLEDTDGDGVPDIIEINTGTDPNVPDSDMNDIVGGITLEMLYKNPLVILDSETGKPMVYGDMNFDRTNPDYIPVLDAFDLVLMRKMYLDGGYADYADLDDDGDLDADDFKWLEDYLLSRVNSFPVYNNFDSDGDGLTDYIEVEIYGTNPHKADTDGDGLSDYFEIVWMETNPLKADCIAYEDPDEDGLINMLESAHKTNPFSKDTDDDGLTDWQEVEKETDPLSPDTDMDGLDDGYEVNTSKTSPIKADTDEDGLNDYEEIQLGLDPLSTTTHGIPDRDYTVNQIIPADDPVFRDINTPDNAYTLSVEIKASGYAKNNLIVRDSSYAYALQDSSAVGFTPEFIYNDDYKVESITLKFEIKEEFRDNVSHYFDAINSGDNYYDYKYEINSELDGIKRFNVFKYFQSINLPMPIYTKYDDNNHIVSVTVDTFETDDKGNSYGIGSYSLVDLEVWGMLMNKPNNTLSTFSDTQNYARSTSSINGSKKVKKSIVEISDSVRDFISRNYQSYNARKAEKTGEKLSTDTTSISSLFGHRYAYYEAWGISYSNADAACRKKGGHLLTVTSPFEYSYLSGTLFSGKNGLYWVGASGKPNSWSWITGESTSYVRTISVNGYMMDSCGFYFSEFDDHLAYCPSLNYNGFKPPKFSDIKGYICEWEPGAAITDKGAGIFSLNIAGNSEVVLKGELSESSGIDSDGDGKSDWDEIDHKTIKNLGGKASDISVPWKKALDYTNTTLKLTEEKTAELVKKIGLVHDGSKDVTPTVTDPGDDDSDGDGYKDGEDPRPNYNDIVVTKLSKDYIMIDYDTVSPSDRVTDWTNKTAKPGMEYISYGGYQGWIGGLTNDITDDTERKYLVDQGCGLIAMADLVLYLARRDPDIFGTGVTNIANVSNPIDFNKYKEYILGFNKSYIDFHKPWYGFVGVNSNDGNMGTLLDDYFKYNSINYNARWCGFEISRTTENICAKRIKDMISRDMPVIISIGPASDKDALHLYNRSKDDLYKKAVYSSIRSVKNHYFNVTAVIEDNVRKEIDNFDGVMYEVSTWGEKYYMSEKEMSDFIKTHNADFTNLVYIEEK